MQGFASAEGGVDRVHSAVSEENFFGRDDAESADERAFYACAGITIERWLRARRGELADADQIIFRFSEREQHAGVLEKGFCACEDVWIRRKMNPAQPAVIHDLRAGGFTQPCAQRDSRRGANWLTKVIGRRGPGF